MAAASGYICGNQYQRVQNHLECHTSCNAVSVPDPSSQVCQLRPISRYLHPKSSQQKSKKPNFYGAIIGYNGKIIAI